MSVYYYYLFLIIDTLVLVLVIDIGIFIITYLVEIRNVSILQSLPHQLSFLLSLIKINNCYSSYFFHY